MSDNDIKQLINQPLDGLLYDLDLLPEQLTPGSREDIIRQVIVVLHERCQPPKRSSLTVTETSGIDFTTEVKTTTTGIGGCDDAS